MRTLVEDWLAVFAMVKERPQQKFTISKKLTTEVARSSRGFYSA